MEKISFINNDLTTTKLHIDNEVKEKTVTLTLSEISQCAVEVNQNTFDAKKELEKSQKKVNRLKIWKNIKTFGKYSRDEVKQFSRNFEYMDYKCLHNNLVFEDFEYFLRYVKGFKKAFTQERWEEYMNTNTYPVFYYKEPYTTSYYPEYRSQPHLDIVDICNIKGFYANDDKNIFRNASPRVAYVINEIVNYENAPIALFRCVDTDTYCLIDGRHRFQAYILLGKRKVFALITDVSSKQLDGFYSDYDYSLLDMYRNTDENIRKTISELLLNAE